MDFPFALNHSSQKASLKCFSNMKDKKCQRLVFASNEYANSLFPFLQPKYFLHILLIDWNSFVVATLFCPKFYCLQ